MIFAVTLISIFSKTIIGFYNLSPEAAKLGHTLILIHGIAVTTVWPMGFTLPNAFRAASDVKFTLMVSIFSMWVFRVGFSYVFALGFGLGVLGVWLAMFSDWSFRATLFITRFISGKWLTKYKPLERK